MGRIEKTVFISYRRTNFPWALAIFQDLTQHGFDVFFDYTGINSGDFESVILENVKARAHFVVLLTPSALERCGEPGDWLRREIETALELNRNVVPLMLDAFDFGAPWIVNQLTGRLEALKRYNGLRILPEYFEEGLARLRNRYLGVTLDAVLHPASDAAVRAAAAQQAVARRASAVPEEQLTATEWFERGYNATDTDEKIRCYSQAILIKPDYSEALVNRGAARSTSGDYDGAIEDLSVAIRTQPERAEAFYNRGEAHRMRGEFAAADQDYTEAIRLRADYADAFHARGVVHIRRAEYNAGTQDLSEVIRLVPNHAVAFNNRSFSRLQTGDKEGSTADFQRYLELGGQHPAMDNAQVEDIVNKLKSTLNDARERLMSSRRASGRQR
jgi:tetratricopeptide (TPR) repeat protein